MRHADVGGIALHDGPDNVGGDALAVDATALVDRSKHAARVDARSREPVINPDLDPTRHGNRTAASSLPQEVDEHPAVFAQLDVLDQKSYQFLAPQAAADEQPEEGAI